MANMSAKFDVETRNNLVSILFTSLFPYMSIVTLTFDLCVTSKINLVHPFVIVNMSVKFDKEAHNGLLSIVFKRSKHDGHTDRRTEPQQRYYIPSATRCTGIKRTTYDKQHSFLQLVLMSY